MGTWGAGAFENDDVLDWVAELSESDDLDLLDNAIEDVLQYQATGEFIESSFGAIGLAAGEVIAALGGSPPPRLPEEVSKWISGKAKPGVALRKRANEAAAMVLNSEISELAQLWQEADPADEKLWREEVKELQKRLSST